MKAKQRLSQEVAACSAEAGDLRRARGGLQAGVDVLKQRVEALTKDEAKAKAALGDGQRQIDSLTRGNQALSDQVTRLQGTLAAASERAAQRDRHQQRLLKEAEARFK